ncbi:MAG: hypothetical protein ABSD03_18215, partial [Vulcanimicrobiaceae bacterium]
MQALGHDDAAARPLSGLPGLPARARHPENPPDLTRDQRREVGQLALLDVLPQPPVVQLDRGQRRALGGLAPGPRQHQDAGDDRRVIPRFRHPAVRRQHRSHLLVG